MVEPTMELLDWFRKQGEQADRDVLHEMLRIFAETLMDADAQSLCNAAYKEKNPERTNTRNGYRQRPCVNVGIICPLFDGLKCPLSDDLALHLRPEAVGRSEP
jgi:hypothetical protein